MAETKKRSTSAKSGSSRRSKATKARSTRKSRPAAKSTTRNGSGANPVEAVRDTVEEKAKSAGKSVGSAGKTVGKAAGKAKVPLIASGAALAGVAGGIALGASRKGHHGGIGAALRKPKIKVDSGDVARVAKEVGSFSNQVGALAGELQRNREAAGNGKHRSPIEVALHGLTSRR